MRQISSTIADLWADGGPFEGDNKPVTRVTVEPSATIHTTTAPSDVNIASDKRPYRWWQRRSNTQTEIELPNLASVSINRNFDYSAATCDLTFYNTDAAEPTQPALGDAGALTWNRGLFQDAQSHFNFASSPWQNVLVPNALLRVYMGYGGDAATKSIAQAKADGNLYLEGVFLVDSVNLTADGKLKVTCRDMMKLLIEQPITDAVIPAGRYPLRYARWKDQITNTVVGHDVPPVTGYGEATPGTMAPGGYARKVVEIIGTNSGLGYWVFGNDGGVFAYGDAPFLGSVATLPLAAEITAAAKHPNDLGYWMVSADGGIFALGVLFHGNTLGLIDAGERAVGIAATKTGDGYWVVSSNGAVYAFGDAQYYGGANSLVLAAPIVAIERTASGNGYWLLGADGGIFAYGDAQFYGSGTATGRTFVDIVRSAGGAGYYLIPRHTPAGLLELNWYGDATDPTLPNNITSDYMTGGWVAGAGKLWMAASDGGVFALGGAGYYGSLPGGFSSTTVSTTTRVDGNYKDLREIISDLACWAGFYLYDDTANPTTPGVYGNLESTGVAPDDPIPESVFDKVPFIDAMKQIAEQVGYYLWVDQEGALHFESPNWFTIGNWNYDGTHTNTVHVADEASQIFELTMTYNDKALRSEIVISSNDPKSGADDVVTTTFVPPSVATELRGQSRPALWVNAMFNTAAEQERMAQLIYLHILMASHTGSVTVPYNPAITVNDQIRIWERTTGEGRIFHIRGVAINHDLEAGGATMQLAVSAIGDSSGITAFNAADYSDIVAWILLQTQAVQRPALALAPAPTSPAIDSLALSVGADQRTVTATASARNYSGGTFTWTWGDGSVTTSSSPTTTHTYDGAVSGQQNVSVTLTKAGQSPATKSGGIVLTPFPSVSGVSLSVNGMTVTASASAFNADGASYIWTWGDGDSTITATPTASHTYDAAGDHVVTVTVRKDGTPDVTASSTGTVSVCPIVNGVTAVIDSAGRTVTANANVTNSGNGESYVWHWGDGTPDTTTTAPTATHTYATTVTGPTIITVTATKTGCTASAAQTTVNIGPPAAACPTVSSITTSFSSDNVTVTATVVGNQSTGSSYSWNWGDSTPDTITTVPTAQHTYGATLTGQRTITVTATKTGCAPVSGSTTVTLAGPPVGCPVASSLAVTLDANKRDVSVVATMVNPIGASYEWDWGDGQTSTTNVPNATHSYATATFGTKTITCTVSKASCPSVPTTATVELPGFYHVNNGQIVDPEGNPFLPIGANFGGPNYFWHSSTGDPATVAAVIGSTASPGQCPAVTGVTLSVGVDNRTVTATIGGAYLTGISASINWGDGNTSTITTTSASHTYTSSGTKTVNVTVSKAGCPNATASASITLATSGGGGGGGGGPTGANFQISGTKIYAPNGQEFVPVGGNVLGEHTFWPNGSSPGLITPIKDWNFNCVRLNNGVPGGTIDAGWGRFDWTDATLDQIIPIYTSQGVVCMISLLCHQSGGWPRDYGAGVGGDGTQPMDVVVSWFAAKAAQWKDNPYVWWNPLNEPGNGQMDMWYSIHADIIDAIRGAGANQPIIIDGTWWGQENHQYDPSFVNESDSAILTTGQTLKVHDPIGNTGFSLHVYETFGIGTQGECDAKMANYMDRVHAKNLYLMVGEFGAFPHNESQEMTQGATAVIHTAPPRGIGVIWWHLQPADGFSLTYSGDLADSNRAPVGQLMWDLTHGGGYGGVVTPGSGGTTGGGGQGTPTCPVIVSLSNSVDNTNKRVTATLTASNLSGATITFNWGDGQTTVGTATTATHTYASAGNYTVAVSITAPGCPTATASGSISITTSTGGGGGGGGGGGTTPPPTGSSFQISGTKIYAPNGQEFYPIGGNVVGEHSFWPNWESPALIDRIKNWNFNFVRLNNGIAGGSIDTGWGRIDWNDASLDQIIASYTAQGVVCMVQLLGNQSGGWPRDWGAGMGGDGTLSLDQFASWYGDKAATYRNNPYVWWNPFNEPGNGQMDMYVSMHNAIIDAIRGAGNTAPIICDGTWWGQENHQYDSSFVNEGDSAILSVGTQVLNHDPLRNVGFALHVYETFGYGGEGAANAKIANYFDRVQAKNLCLMVGEFGAFPNNESQEMTNAANAVISQAPPRGIGMCWWHLQPGDGFSLTYDGTLTGSRSPVGQRFWDVAHSLGGTTGGGSTGGGGGAVSCPTISSFSASANNSTKTVTTNLGVVNITGATAVYNWGDGQTTNSTAVSQTHTYASTGTYTITVTISKSGCATVSSSTTVTISSTSTGGGGGGGGSPSSNFHVSGTQMLAPNGSVFVAMGGNINGEHCFWPNYDSASSSFINTVKNVWNMNIVAAVSGPPGGAPGTDYGGGRPDWTDVTIDTIVNNWSAAGIPVICRMNGNYSGGWPRPYGAGPNNATGEQDMTFLVDYYASLAYRFRDNPYCWYQPLAEPGTGEFDLWRQYHKDIILAIRNAGGNQPILLTGTYWGQENNAYGSDTVPYNTSAILQYGQELLQFDPAHNVVMDMHCYNTYGYGLNQTQADHKVADFIDRVHAAGLCLYFEEFGGYGNNADGDLYRAWNAVFNTAPQRGVGIIWWHLQPGDGYDLTNTGNLADSNNRTEAGNRYWTILHS